MECASQKNKSRGIRNIASNNVIVLYKMYEVFLVVSEKNSSTSMKQSVGKLLRSGVGGRWKDI